MFKDINIIFWDPGNVIFTYKNIITGYETRKPKEREEEKIKKEYKVGNEMQEESSKMKNVLKVLFIF